MSDSVENTAPTSYSAASEELNEILTELEGGKIDVDLLVTRVERARVLVAFCRERLQGAQTQIRDVLADLTAATSAE